MMICKFKRYCTVGATTYTTINTSKLATSVNCPLYLFFIKRSSLFCKASSMELWQLWALAPATPCGRLELGWGSWQAVRSPAVAGETQNKTKVFYWFEFNLISLKKQITGPTGEKSRFLILIPNSSNSDAFFKHGSATIWVCHYLASWEA